MNKQDKELLKKATEVLREHYLESRHTAAAAARLKDGAIITAINSQHFTGFVCAETALLNLVINQKNPEIDTIVCVHYKHGTKKAEMVNPCGKCRQILLEYSPGVSFLVSDKDRIMKMPVADLLPYAYVQSHTKRIWNEN
jgi:cytidine deaminase